MNIEEAIKILDYKINMYKEDVFIGDLDKTNIEAIKKVLEEIERLNKENNDLRILYQRTCNHLFKIGNDELARYFQAQINECNTFTPQGVDKK